MTTLLEANRTFIGGGPNARGHLFKRSSQQKIYRKKFDPFKFSLTLVAFAGHTSTVIPVLHQASQLSIIFQEK